ncbi:DUF2306 domain-containing protein [Caulobacter mirabilis]|nr:DUF2306 domain-containing protein [Caulobacter mirabilis]
MELASETSKRAVLAGRADGVLNLAVRLWWLVSAAGLWLFAVYIAGLYGLGVVGGDMDRWNRVLPDGHGYVRGDAAGNAVLGVHLLMALIVTVGGVLQLVPWLRRVAPGVHRWNGRLFLSVGMVAAVTGVFIALSRGAVAGNWMTAGNILNATLILVCGAQAWRHAAAKRFAVHRRWALRAFVLINAVWFYRLGMMAWFAIHQGPVGHTDAFDGPFDIFLAFGHVLVPLGGVELYLAARDRGGEGARLAMAVGVLAGALVMGLGVAAAALGLWLPRL